MYKQKEYYPCAGEFFHRLPKIIEELNFAVHRTGFLFYVDTDNRSLSITIMYQALL